MKSTKLLVVVAALALLCAGGCSGNASRGSDSPDNSLGFAGGRDAVSLDREAKEIVASLTLEEKVAQLFIISPEALTGYNTVTAAGRVSEEAYSANPVGGLIYFAKNLEDPKQTRTMLTNMAAYSVNRVGVPVFLCVDEEGGDVARVAQNPAFGVQDVGDASALGATGDVQAVADAASYVASYLADLGFNVNFAPVADVVSDPAISSMAYRSFGADPALVADMVAADVTAQLAAGVLPCAKHFPGIGNTVGDSHTGSITLNGSLADLQGRELVPFKAAIDAGVPFVMVGHVSVPTTGSGLPASLNPIIIQGVLRGDLGYDGVVITDALNMAAVSGVYRADRIGVEVLLAGGDMILMPTDYPAAFNGILDAVKSGELTEARIDESVLRIVKLKLSL